MVEVDERLKRDGAVRLPGLVLNQLDEWIKATQPHLDLGKPGLRISNSPELNRLAWRLASSSAFIAKVGKGWACVRAIAFNKSPQSNWSLAWHQDRTIAVAKHERVSRYTNWSTKDGVAHVEPPFSLLERMITLRIHLDPVDSGNAPLMVALGSHKFGKLAESDIDDMVQNEVTMTCHAKAGDGWLYATPIVHASARSVVPESRRVIHLDFSRDALPAPLEWAGIE